ncbi:unnamed protein product [Mesocestoides corti]|uniref:Dynein regulatory complex protein 10 n=1 Tax=Mesocestoides corti TaxID=53468 RepID=A0A0R3UFM4_MESCO|nr:unnamed protein product [Mesocestoides corti]
MRFACSSPKASASRARRCPPKRRWLPGTDSTELEKRSRHQIQTRESTGKPIDILRKGDDVLMADFKLFLLKEKYDTMMKTFRDEEAQLKEYESKISALKVEHEAVLAEQEAQKVREREAAEREARLAENCSVIQAYCRAFLTRREAALKRQAKRKLH